MRKLILAGIGTLLTHAVSAQAILQGGPWAPAHVPMYILGGSQPVVMDSGPAGGGGPGVGLNELGMVQQGTGTGPYQTNLCDYDAPVSSGNYHYLCMGPSGSTGGGVIAYGAAGTAAPLPLTINADVSSSGNITANNFSVTKPITFSGDWNWAASTGIITNMSVTGTDSVNTGDVPYNYMNISSDNLALTNGPDVGGDGLLVYDNFGGASARGQRAAISAQLIQTARTGNNGPLTGWYPTYAALGGNVRANANDNGTGLTSTTASGQITGIVSEASLLTGATYWWAVQGEEVDVSMATGTSAYEKIGLEITQYSTDAVQGSVVDAALIVINQPSSVGWKNGIILGNSNANVISSGGTIFTGLDGATLATGFDLTGFTISGNAWQSTGASINGAGAITGSGLTAGGNSVIGPAITINGAAASARQVAFDTAGSARWNCGAGSGAESGTAVGSDFYCNRYDNSGTYIDTPFKWSRATGMATWADGLTSGAGLAITAGNLNFTTLPSGTAATYACFTSGGNLVSSVTAC